jgi:uncharacterized protein YjbI with pentapeptide repeats
MNRDERRRDYTMMALIALGVVALLAVVIWVPKLSFIQPGGLTKATDRAKAESDLRGHLLQALAGLVLAVGAFYTGRTFAQTRKEQDRTYALAREGQITERFTRAVEQLGDEKLDIRLGGIYALERIARDSETHYEPVMEVLTAFLRENTRWRREKEAEGAPGEPKRPPWASGPTADFQAVATVLARRDRRHERPDYRLDLNRVDLRGASLQEADLSGADLKEANLSKADLSLAKLGNTGLIRADLGYALLTEADLTEADLSEAYLTGAGLGEAKLRGANLSGAKLGKTSLIRADLAGAYFVQADLTGAYLSGADLTGADFYEAFLSESVIRGANLTGAKLTKAVLTGADLRKANLTEADLSGADLTRRRTSTGPTSVRFEV